MKTMVDLKRDPETVKSEAPCAMPCDASKPVYPYGLSISFDDETMKKLKIDVTDCEVGGIMHLHCMARVTSVSANDYGDGMSCRLELQIESMAVESEDAENEEAEAAEPKPKKRRLSEVYGDA